jgi:ACR3 family arsenite efflux pump ArsB
MVKLLEFIAKNRKRFILKKIEEYLKYFPVCLLLFFIALIFDIDAAIEVSTGQYIFLATCSLIEIFYNVMSIISTVLDKIDNNSSAIFSVYCKLKEDDILEAYGNIVAKEVDDNVKG